MLAKEKYVVLVCHNKLSISTKIHLRARITASSITDKRKGAVGLAHAFRKNTFLTFFVVVIFRLVLDEALFSSVQ